ncbi:MAG: hypothetical protein QOD81_2248 [Solirubrobacteraceae bacterium]|jgi:hypothetical protein|nr:hypothetical protein [Solirubrobacteraceae bacterium]
MDRIHQGRSAAVAAIAAATLATAMPVSALATPPHRHGGPGGHDPAPGATAAGHLPAGWPRDVPVPPGRIQGSTGGSGRWTVELLVRGSAAHALRSTIAFYRAHGFRGSGAVVHRGSRKITVVVENRDHSANETFIVIGLTALRG